MAFLIREATAADALDVATVHVRSWQSAYRNIVPDDYLDNLDIDNRSEQFIRSLAEYRGVAYPFVVESDGVSIGNLSVGKCLDVDRPHAGEIYSIYLLREYWGMGYGKMTMDFAINKLRELGYSDISLWVLEDNIRAKNAMKGAVLSSTERGKRSLSGSLFIKTDMC